MKKGFLAVLLPATAIATVFSLIYFSNVRNDNAAANKSVDKAVSVDACYGCHEPIKKLHTIGKHSGINCVNCHRGLDKHLASLGPEARPDTITSREACGECHHEQFDSFMQVALHRPANDEIQLSNDPPNPFWDKLMAGFGITKKHSPIRNHANVRPYQLMIDTRPTAAQYHDFIPQIRAVANPVCLQCKSQDQILKWSYMGDTVEGKTTWDRTSFAPSLAKDLQRGLNCISCHDPHAAKPRVVRDGLIQALTRPEADTLWHKDARHTNFKVIDMGVRGFTRKIALLDKYDTRLQCGQCHVEYTGNPGYDPRNPDTSTYSVTMADIRTNHFPYKDVLNLYEHYSKQVHFLDFKHTLTGGLLWKAQHPESETYYNSTHAKAGVGCDSCHTPKMISGKTGKTYTSHNAVTPRVQLEKTCLAPKCHPTWTEDQAKYSIDAIKAFGKEKIRQAEFWLAALIDKIVEAKKAGIGPEVLKQAQDQHLRAHILWEYWTAENSDGFHNPELARESLTRSVDESQKGIKLLNDAMAPKTTATSH